MVSKLKAFLHRHDKYAAIIYFILGFIWDWVTLERIDQFYSNFVLLGHLICLMISLYIFNLAGDGRWEGTFLEKYQSYSSLAIQFFLGALVSAYMVFFFRSASLGRTMVFLILLMFLYIANEMFKHRISNKYLQFGAFFFVAFTYFEFIIPVFVGTMSTFIFIISGFVALGLTLFFIQFVYWKSPSTRREVNLAKLSSIIVGIYIMINAFYYFNMIPPVPLALESGLMAYHIDKKDNSYWLSYDRDKTYKIWRSYNHEMAYMPGDSIFAYTSIFAPTDLNKEVAHRWKWYNPEAEQWEVSDEIGYEVKGGRDGGYRGFTFKTNLQPGDWEIDVITKEGLILGTINFELEQNPNFEKDRLVYKEFK